MNWLDLVLIVGVATGALLGMWIGLIRAAFAVAGVSLGVLLAGHLKDNVAGLLAGYVSNETLASAMGYAVTVSVAVAGAVIAASIVRKIAYGLFLGWADRLAGLGLGLMAAIVVTAAAIFGMADLAYRYELPREGLAGTILEKTPRVAEATERLRDSLDGSDLVSMFLDVRGALPGGAPDLAPSDLRPPLANLEERVE
jgi:hypothetical protein